jgi:predicted dehydrogenase
MAALAAAIAGTGFMGPAHAEGLRRLGVTVVGILGSTPEKSRRAAEQLAIGTAYDSYEQLLADERVQVVHVTTPNRLHYPMAKAALAAGKHVLCEKPLAMTAAESAELVELASRSGKRAGVNYNIRFYPLCLEARERVRRGDAGEVYSVQGSYVQDWLLFDTDYNWRVLADEGGALRAVADIGTHWLDLVQTITGLRVEALCADLHTIHPVRRRPRGEVQTFAGASPEQELIPVGIETEDIGAILLRFAGPADGRHGPADGRHVGARGALWVSQATAGRKNRLSYEIAGAKAALAWDSERPNELWLGHRDRANETLAKDPGLLSPGVRPFVGYPGGHDEGYPDTFKQCFRAFYDGAGYPTFEDGHHEIVLCEAILESHRTQKWVRV